MSKLSATIGRSTASLPGATLLLSSAETGAKSGALNSGRRAAIAEGHRAAAIRLGEPFLAGLSSSGLYGGVWRSQARFSVGFVANGFFAGGRNRWSRSDRTHPAPI